MTFQTRSVESGECDTSEWTAELAVSSPSSHERSMNSSPSAWPYARLEVGGSSSESSWQDRRVKMLNNFNYWLSLTKSNTRLQTSAKARQHVSHPEKNIHLEIQIYTAKICDIFQFVHPQDMGEIQNNPKTNQKTNQKQTWNFLNGTILDLIIWSEPQNLVGIFNVVNPSTLPTPELWAFVSQKPKHQEVANLQMLKEFKFPHSDSNVLWNVMISKTI